MNLTHQSQSKTSQVDKKIYKDVEDTENVNKVGDVDLFFTLHSNVREHASFSSTHKNS